MFNQSQYQLLMVFHRSQCWVCFYLSFIFYLLVKFFTHMALISMFTQMVHSCTYLQNLIFPFSILSLLNVSRLLKYEWLIIFLKLILTKVKFFLLDLGLPYLKHHLLLCILTTAQLVFPSKWKALVLYLMVCFLLALILIIFHVLHFFIYVILLDFCSLFLNIVLKSLFMLC